MRFYYDRHPDDVLGIGFVDAANNTEICEPGKGYSISGVKLGMMLIETGIGRFIQLFVSAPSSPIANLPEDVHNEYFANMMRPSWFRTFADEGDVWGSSCAVVDSIDRVDEYGAPVAHVLPSRGIYRDDLSVSDEIIGSGPNASIIL